MRIRHVSPLATLLCSVSFLMFLMITLVPANPLPVLGNDRLSLIIEAPESLQPVAKRLQEVDPRTFLQTMDLVGLTRPGPPIRVILAPEDSSLARQAPRWASGYALSHISTVVLLPERVTNYPYESIEEVLSHEIAHILIHRAAGERPLPRWLDEGLAMVAAREWNMEDRARLVWAMVAGTRISLDQLNALFSKDGSSAGRAYALAHAFTLDILEHTQPDFPKHILALVAQGAPFHEAFAQAAMMPLGRAEGHFWRRQTLWDRWIPVATSSAVLWFLITVLVFYAFKKQRSHTAAIKKQWEEEERDP